MIYFKSYYTSFAYFYFKIFYLRTQILERTVRQALATKAPACAKLPIAQTVHVAISMEIVSVGVWAGCCNTNSTCGTGSDFCGTGVC